jgi:hypothetical protein
VIGLEKMGLLHAGNERFIRRLFKTDEGPVDKKQLDTRIDNVARWRAAPRALT